MDWPSDLRVCRGIWAKRGYSTIVVWKRPTRSNRTCKWAYPPRNCEFSDPMSKWICALPHRGCSSIGLSIVLRKHICPCILHVLGGYVRRGYRRRIYPGMSEINAYSGRPRPKYTYFGMPPAASVARVFNT